MNDTIRESFETHENLLVSVIKDQCGDLWKALLEGAQNCMDAGATSISFTVDHHRIVIADDGKGFLDDDEIKRYFKTFGTPHEEGDSLYGRFRMGRGQMFSYGVNRWYSNHFILDVDLNNKGMGYEKSYADKPFNGTKIEIDLYERLSKEELYELEREMSRAVKYYSIPVYYNGKQISAPPQNETWSMETDDAYIRFKDTQSIQVYHIGTFICEMSASALGRGGVIVAKNALNVNFARNAIKDHCPIWRRIRKAYQDACNVENKTRTRLDDAAKENMVKQFIAGKINISDIFTRRLFNDATGSSISLSNILKRGIYTLSCSEVGDKSADRALQIGRALVFSKDTLERFDAASVRELVALISRRNRDASGAIIRHDLGQFLSRCEIIDTECLHEEFENSFEIIPKGNLKPLEKVWLSALEATFCSGMTKMFSVDKKPRRFYVGISPCADMWTDGNTFIAVNRDFLRDPVVNKRGIAGFAKVIDVAIHEFCHDENTEGSHVHDKSFYQEYHDLLDSRALLLEKFIENFERAAKSGVCGTSRDLRRLNTRIDRIQMVTQEIEKETAKIENLHTEVAKAKSEETAARQARRDVKKAAKKRASKKKQNKTQSRISTASASGEQNHASPMNCSARQIKKPIDPTNQNSFNF